MIKDLGLDIKQFEPKTFRHHISQLKNNKTFGNDFIKNLEIIILEEKLEKIKIIEPINHFQFQKIEILKTMDVKSLKKYAIELGITEELIKSYKKNLKTLYKENKTDFYIQLILNYYDLSV